MICFNNRDSDMNQRLQRILIAVSILSLFLLTISLSVIQQFLVFEQSVPDSWNTLLIVSGLTFSLSIALWTFVLFRRN